MVLKNERREPYFFSQFVRFYPCPLNGPVFIQHTMYYPDNFIDVKGFSAPKVSFNIKIYR
jgi:hypothetical protein